MKQTWNDLLFGHWRVPAAELRASIPKHLELDTFNGDGFLAVTPFHMTGVRGRGVPPIPGISAFPELNVRTYVRYEDKPGVFFFSLDAGSRLAVLGARAAYHLPYFFSIMKATVEGEAVSYFCRRQNGAAEFNAHYRPIGPVRQREKGSLEHFLTERYCLYVVSGEKLYRADIHHVPWPLQDAAAEIETNTMASAAGFNLGANPDLLHFSKRLEVLIWPLKRLV